MLKNDFLFIAFFYRFLAGLGRVLQVFWGALGGLKFKTLPLGPSQNALKFAQDAQKVDFGMRFGRVFFRRLVWGGFWVHFGRNFGGF